MTNLDVMTTILSEVTGRPAQQWRAAIRASVVASGRDIGDTELLTELPQDEADGLLRKLRRERSGVLNWLLQGAQAAQHTTHSERRLRVFGLNDHAVRDW